MSAIPAALPAAFVMARIVKAPQERGPVGARPSAMGNLKAFAARRKQQSDPVSRTFSRIDAGLTRVRCPFRPRGCLTSPGPELSSVRHGKCADADKSEAAPR
ncbi:hypothetical protein GCM10007887_36550 [Methylobacterium haplocladii]|uniref:Uncharacterized protein n=1 Tax=Methylobacterium haplocladii TaxID=1176176 RepID=A0A512IL72_9HYPH|nr:hypothetical protein MHA02_08440 [Methylobacterium haplocladii]GLS60963.1 hypothetical protein GCM10007887_36550 [Methylobacterium haplocladii]